MRQKGISSILLPVFFIFLLFACSDDDPSPGRNLPLPDPPNQTLSSYTYLALGDSYTIGESVDTAFRWPNQLRDSLDSKGVLVTEVKIIARTGWTTGELIQAIEDEAPRPRDLVSLLIGVNNQFRRLPFAEFQEEFDSLLSIARELATDADRVFVVSIPDYGVTPFGSFNRATIAQELDAYNDYMHDKCRDLRVPFINITEISRELGDSEGALAFDNLHPSGFQYSLWVEEILPAVLATLGE
ncbi:MAG: SGNH/GDSL hydrolase family protein [Bacteroidota bacterium]